MQHADTVSAARQLDSTAIQARAAKIRCLFPDIDGVMTDCKLYLTPEGEEIKTVDVRMKALILAAPELG